MDKNAINILKVRRLIREGRYIEAQYLLMETCHSSVPVLDKQIRSLIAANKPLPPPPGVRLRGMFIYAILGAVAFGGMAVTSGIYSPYGIGVILILGVFFGLLMQEVQQRRQNTIDFFFSMYFERRRQQHR